MDVFYLIGTTQRWPVGALPACVPSNHATLDHERDVCESRAEFHPKGAATALQDEGWSGRHPNRW